MTTSPVVRAEHSATTGGHDSGGDALSGEDQELDQGSPEDEQQQDGHHDRGPRSHALAASAAVSVIAMPDHRE